MTPKSRVPQITQAPILGTRTGMSDEKIKRGDRVSWKSSQGTIDGTVEKKLTSPTDIKGHHVAASPENPEVLVKSEKTGAIAAHKPGSLKKKRG